MAQTSEQITTDGDALDAVFRALSDGDRRRILMALLEKAKWEEDRLVDVTTGDTDLKDEIRYRHNHLPNLAESGFIEFDAATGICRRGERFDVIRRYLELLSDNQEQLPLEWP